MRCWDCGTGNGQVAQKLAGYFTEVYATDISGSQISEAPKTDNIHYSVTRAEKTEFENGSFDLITVAQALHWFDIDAFHREARRVLKSFGVLAVWGYGLIKVNPQIDQIVSHFYHEVIGQYWDPERKLVDDRYENIYFPLEEIKCPDNIYIESKRSMEEFLNYIRTWSSVRHYKNKFHLDPVINLEEKLLHIWPHEKYLNVRHPVFIRMGIYSEVIIKCNDSRTTH